MTAVMIYEMVRNYQAMGTPIAIKVCISLMHKSVLTDINLVYSQHSTTWYIFTLFPSPILYDS